MKFLKSAAAIAVVAAAAATPAQAAISGNAIGSFSYVLFDMDETDAVTPSISFQPNYGGASSSIFSVDQSSEDSSYYEDNSYYDAPIRSVSVTQGLTTTTATTAGTSVFAGGNSSGKTEPSYYTSFSSNAFSNQYFNLTANTVVVFQMNYQLTANSNAYEGYESIYSQVGMELQIDKDFENEDSDGDGSYHYQFVSRSIDAYEGQSITKNGKLFISYASDRATSGYLNLSANTNGYTNVSAVPEPETYAMLLAGLGLIGTVARRRKAKQA